MKIIATKLETTAENERTFSTLKRVLSEKRERLSDSHVGDLVKISFEMRREFGGEIHKITKYTNMIKPLIEKRQKARRVQVQSAMSRMRPTRKASTIATESEEKSD